MEWVSDDGGRAAAGFKGDTGDCVTRAIAIATGLPYGRVYDEIKQRNGDFYATSRSRKTRTRNGSPRRASPRLGAYRDVYEAYLAELGWTWTPTMYIGSGCTVHLREDELPAGRLIVSVSKHLTAVLDGVIHDTHDPSRDGTRCVYGYFFDPTEREGR